jgi:hypothetical protein
MQLENIYKDFYLIKIKKEFLKWIKVINIANLFDIATTIF